MRIKSLAVFFALSLGACTGTLTDDPDMENPDPDPDPNPDPGTGSGANGLNVNVDRSAITTEYMTSHPIKVTIQGTGGFSGAVNLTAGAFDSNNTAITGWTVDLAQASVTLAANGSAEVNATLRIPSATVATTAVVKFTATAGSTVVNVNTNVTAARQITFEVPANGNICQYNPAYGNAANRVPVYLGTTLRFVNKSTLPMVIHGKGVIPHQSTQAGQELAANAAYMPNIQTAGAGSWYCHTLNGVGNGNNPGNAGPAINMMAPPT